MKVTSEHAEAIGQSAGVGVEKGLLLDRIALHSGRVSPRNKEFATAIETDFADSWLSLRNGTAMAAGETADALVAEVFDEARIGFSDSPVKDITQGLHWRNL